MQVSKQSIYQFLEGSEKTFVIPVYQRDYAWRVENCKKLWQDLLELEKTQKPNHFLGTIVNIYDKLDERLIVDGQQRLTTVSLLLLAIENYLKQKQDKSEEENILQEQLLDFLINKYSRDKNKRIRLKPNKQDKDYFNQLFENPEIKNDSNIVQNYNYFYQKLKALEIEPLTLFNLFRKLEIVNIELERQYDDPQLIFESLNSTGVDLTDGDLIRNYILTDLDPQTQERFYFDYWIKIENLTSNIAEFVRNFLMFRLGRNITQIKRAVYNEFKLYSEDNFGKDSQRILEEILKYAQVYSYFIRQSNHSSQNIDARLARLWRLEFTVAWPYLFEVFDLFERGVLDSKGVSEIIQLIESYVFRKIFVTKTTSGLNQLFLTLAKEIKKTDPENYQNQYLDILKFILKTKTVSQTFPTDEQFINALVYQEIYHFSPKNRDFLLENLENYNSSYRVDLQDLQVEHILPQNATKWKNYLGTDWEEIRNKYVHTLGNLTLTANNSRMSNKDFESKQVIDFHTSKLKLSYTLGDQTVWNEQTILERAQKLANEATKIWAYPDTTYQRPIEPKEIYSFEEEVDFSGKKPKMLYFEENNFEIKHWRDVLKIMCDELYDYSPTEFNHMMINSEIQSYFASSTENNLRSPIPFNNNKFVTGGLSANSIVYLSRKMCEYLDFEISKVSVEF